MAEEVSKTETVIQCVVFFMVREIKLKTPEKVPCKLTARGESQGTFFFRVDVFILDNEWYTIYMCMYALCNNFFCYDCHDILYILLLIIKIQKYY